jgi:hypothetical protein
VHHERHIVLGSNEIGCRVARCPKDVRMSKKRKDFLTWHISNSSDQGSSCDRRVEVCIGNWRLAGQSVDAPVQGRGGGPGQAGRVLLTEWTDFNLSDPAVRFSDRCNFSGTIVAETILEGDPADASPPARPSRQAYPIKWEGPVAAVGKRMTKAALVDVLHTADADARVELLLTLELESRQSAACLDRLEGSLQVVKISTSETTTNAPILSTKYWPQFYLRPWP